MESELTYEQQQTLKYYTFIGDPTSHFKCHLHLSKDCQLFCRGCKIPICNKCISKHQNAGKDANTQYHQLIDIEDYASQSLQSYISVYLQMEEERDRKKELLKRRDKLIKKEYQELFIKVHKFISHFLVHAQEQLLGSLDQEFSQWQLERDEFVALQQSGNFNELFIRRHQIQQSKREIRSYLKEYLPKINHNDIIGDARGTMYDRLKLVLADLIKVIDFSVTTDKGNSFDQLLDSARVDELERQLQQQTYLIERDQLREKLIKMKDNLNFVFRDVDNVGLTPQYNTLLDESTNPDIKAKFERIERNKGGNQSYTYFGQLNSKGQMHGIGSMLFLNGFCYQGMFRKGQREGLGISYDLNNNKYKGEHVQGIREGKGIYKSSDGKIYEGAWSSNKMHGRGREKHPSGECYLVYYKDGLRKDALISQKAGNQPQGKTDKSKSNILNPRPYNRSEKVVAQPMSYTVTERAQRSISPKLKLVSKDRALQSRAFNHSVNPLCVARCGNQEKMDAISTLKRKRKSGCIIY